MQAKCFRHDVRPTSAAKRCDTSEETRISAVHVKHLHECLAGLEELPLGDGPFKCLDSGALVAITTTPVDHGSYQVSELPALSTAVTAGSRRHSPDDI